MKLSHRLRLTLSAAIVAAVLLAAIFISTYAFAYQLEAGESRATLRSVVRQAMQATENGQPSNVRGIVQADPTLSIALFTKGQRSWTAGNFEGREREGFSIGEGETGQIAQLGVRTGNRMMVAVMDWDLKGAALYRLLVILTVLYLPLVGAVAGTTWMAARATFRPLESLTRQAAEIGGTDVSGRLEVQDDAEFGSFAVQLNSMLDRLETMVKRQEQFASDAAHELRTPLTIVRGKIETSLLRERSQSDYQKTLNQVLTEMERLSSLVEGLLRSARSVNEPAPPLNLRPSVEAVVERWQESFKGRSVKLASELEDACAAMKEDEVASVLDNLLGNALRHSPPRSECRIRLYRASNRVVLEVSDQGPGLAKDIEEKVFERFVRGEPSRNRTKGGFGIGLSICKQILQSRQGDIEAENNEDGGATFRATVTETPL